MQHLKIRKITIAKVLLLNKSFKTHLRKPILLQEVLVLVFLGVQVRILGANISIVY